MKKKHPMQPVIWDGKGVVRFQENPIVSFLLEWASEKGMGLNELHRVADAAGWTRADWSHFSQLHGYSVSGWGDLSYATDAEWEKAWAKQAALIAKYPEDPADPQPGSPEEAGTFSFPSDTCAACGEVRVHHQHPLKPPGVSMMATCGCTRQAATHVAPHPSEAKPLADRIRDIWHEANEDEAFAAEHLGDFANWSGATKDLLIVLGYEWSNEADDYVRRTTEATPELESAITGSDVELTDCTVNASEFIQCLVTLAGGTLKDCTFVDCRFQDCTGAPWQPGPASESKGDPR